MANTILTDLSTQVADAVERAAAFVLPVRSRRWRPAAGVAFAAGHLLVADHALEHEEDITVRAGDGRVLPATIAGRDPSSDLAVLEVEGLGATPPSPAAGSPRVGHLAVAVGRAWSGGVVSALGMISSIGGPWRATRGPGEVEQVLRTDITPYAGFTGGALLAADGSLLAVSTGILVRGLSLAIPAALAWPIAETLVRHGGMRRAFLGVGVEAVRLPESQYPAGPRRGLVVVGVADSSPAQNAGLMIGDVLLSFNGQPADDPEALLSLLTGDLIGRTVAVDILRGGARKTIHVALGERGSARRGA